MNTQDIDQLGINTLRVLGADIVEKAKSGHPGLPMGAAAMAYVLWTGFLRHNPQNPNWPNRDRFVLSAGHGSALLYSLLHLTGYDLPLEELKRFRQWESKTPGHPEYGLTPGVETTTGPLGQGISNAVGMAMAEAFLAEHFNRDNFPVVDYHTYVICGDGDLMEGVSSEAASIAGHLKLGKLIVLYDDNQISIEGSTGLAFTESVGKRFEAYGWQVLEVDGNDPQALAAAITQAREESARPSIIKARTHIGFGSPHKQDTASAHGEPLGEEELRQVKERFGFSPDQSFVIPEAASARFREAISVGQSREEDWLKLFKSYKKSHAELAQSFQEALKRKLPKDWDADLPVFAATEKLATRAASGKVLNALVQKMPLLVGGSADLAPSTSTHLKGYCDFSPDQYNCPNFHFGVREHGMGAIVNGMALSGLLTPYGATFLTFSDYMRPTIRLAALMDVSSIFVFTHDSIAMGEDGPTHQPVEHVMSLRAIPGLTVIRPADANETAAAWRLIMTRRKPTALILTRQALPVLDTQRYPIATGVFKGAYALTFADEKPDLILMATGSEVNLALTAGEKLGAQGIKTRVISMPSWDIFREQSPAYQKKVLPPRVKARVAIEAGTTLGWRQWVGDKGAIVGIDRFGASAPGDIVMENFGFSVENVVNIALNLKGGRVRRLTSSL